MTSVRCFRLKHSCGWFAAGREVAAAATLLSDAAFKLFVWLCLHADRSRGSLSATPVALARALDRSGEEISLCLEELVRKKVCQYSTAGGAIEIADQFWPYERIRSANAELSQYIERIRRAFLSRHCVRSTFTPADERIAAKLYQAGVSITDVEHAILLGALRKYIAVLNNNGGGTPITSLRYFESLLQEVRQPLSSDYWAYVEHKVHTLEQRLTRSAQTIPETK